MVSPNFFLKLNISFTLIIGLLIIYNNYFQNKFNLLTNIAALFFIYVSINNIVILKQKSNPNLKKEILKINTLLYCILTLFMIINIKNNKNIEIKVLLIFILIFFINILNYIGYKITISN